MCTVSLVPTRRGEYLLVSNRDERPIRGPAAVPVLLRRGRRKVAAPIDGDAGGTWIGVDDRGDSLCLLNGDDSGRAVQDPAAPSRGLLVMELLEDARPEAVWSSLNERHQQGRLRENPFRLVLGIAEPRDGSNFCQFEWNGRELGRRWFEGPQVLISNGYDLEAVRKRREQGFAELLQSSPSNRGEEEDSTLQALLAWHASHFPEAPAGDVHSVCMHHDNANTVSMTAVAVRGQQIEMTYRPGHPCRFSAETTVRLSRTCSK